ncbi:regulatory protein RecX [Modestobacter roseus]|uniref:regulatory protein RecX n=1 Tax=Modestobacter roseus TaxID=1181884 RepID=UPI0034DF9ECD
MSDSLSTSDGPAEDHARPAGGETHRAGRRRSGWSSAGRSGGGDRGARSSRAERRPGRDQASDRPEDEPRDPAQEARAICLRALTGASKTRKQLADLLATREIPDEVAATVLDRFTEVGLIDDAAFAAAWVSSRQSSRGLARRALASELRAKGVDGEVAAAAVAEVDPQDEWDTARRLVERKLPGMRRLDRVTAERRLVGMLARKGYGGGLAGYVVREALDALTAELLAEDERSDEEAGSLDGGSADDGPRDDGPRDDGPGSGAAEVGEGQARRLGRRAAQSGDVWEDYLP